MTRFPILSSALILCLILVSCSGSSSPVTPPGSFDKTGLTPGNHAASHGQTSKTLWGMWDVTIDTKTGDVQLAPLRGAQFTVNVVKFMQPPLGSSTNMHLTVTNLTEWLSEGKIGLDVAFTNPFPGFDQFSGFDVFGVLVTAGNTSGLYDTDASWSDGDDAAVLLNKDGFTRWMNPVEFLNDQTIFSFYPGAAGTADIGMFTATLNPYKYFADGLDADEDVGDFYASSALNVQNRGIFRAGSTNHREYHIQFPMPAGSPVVRFQYAIVASWLNPDKTLSGNPDVLEIPGDFPLSANADEPINVEVTDNSTVYYSGGIGGGDIILDLEIFDWAALDDALTVPDEIHRIVVEGDPSVIPGGYAVFDNAELSASASPGTTAISSVFQVEITGVTPQSQDNIPLFLTIESENPGSFDAGNGYVANSDRLAAYFTTEVAVTEILDESITVTSPNGGETLYMTLDHEITWSSVSITISSVMIEWSVDDFASDINLLAGSTENDGSYTWDYIPKVDTDTAKIRISNLSESVSDMSDDYFSIKPPVILELTESVTPSPATVDFSGTEYIQPWDEMSPALSQDNDGLVHLCWHSEKAFIDDPDNLHREAREVGIRSVDGDSWNGEGGFFFTWGGSPTGTPLRGDYLKLAPAANNTTYIAVWHWKIYFSVDVDHFPNSHNYYNAYTLFNRIYINAEIMADADYLYTVSDGAIDIAGQDGPGIYSYRQLTPNYSWPGWPDSTDPLPVMNTLTDYGEVSHSRSWAFQDGLLVMAYYTLDGQVKLLRQTDQVNDIWDNTEIIYDGIGYLDSAHPALCFDDENRLFAVWNGQEINSGENYLLASKLEASGDTWSEPMVIATSATDVFEDQHISMRTMEYEFPNGDMVDLLLVAYEIDNMVTYQILMADAWDWLPPMQVSEAGEITRDPDAMCMNNDYIYDALIAWSYEIIPGDVGYGDYDIKFVNADFVTP